MTARDRTMLLVLLAAGLLAAGWFLVLAPQREEAAQLADQVLVQQGLLDAARAEVEAGNAAKAGYAADYATVARLGAAVPSDDNLPSLLVQLEQAAKASGVDFRTLELASGSGAGDAAPPPPDDGPAAASQAATATLPPGAAVGPAGFPTMPFRFEFAGDFFSLSDFIGRLERFLVVRNRSVAVNGRFMTVDGIALTAAPEGFPRMVASVAATTYLLPPSQGLTDGATAGGPAQPGTPASDDGGGVSTGPATATPVGVR